MSRAPQIRFLAEGKRLHLQDGPIDLIVEACAGEVALLARDRPVAVLDLCAQVFFQRTFANYLAAKVASRFGENSTGRNQIRKTFFLDQPANGNN